MIKTTLGLQKKWKISFKRKTMFTKAIEIVKTTTYITCTLIKKEMRNQWETREIPSHHFATSIFKVFFFFFFTVIRNRLYNFVWSNKLIELDIQECFWKDASGCIKQTETLSCIINSARLKQPILVITLLDFENEIDEVHKNLKMKFLKIHHVS